VAEQPFLPYGRQDITDDDVEAVARALREPMITQGPGIDRFEARVAERLGARHCVALANGTAALHAAMAALEIGPGDEVLTTPITFAASANCALYRGASVRFVDIDPATWNLDPAAAAAAVGERTRAIVTVSFAGLPAELGPLRATGLPVVEDAAHALGAVRAGRPVGGPGGAELTTFSLHPVKVLTTGEGGLVTTEDDALAARLRRFRTHGIGRDGEPPSALDGGWWYDMTELGFNYRITDVQCALGESQLRRLDAVVERRNALAARYRELLGAERRIELPPAPAPGDVHAYHLFVIRIRAGAAARRAVYDRLRAAGIGVQVHYIPVYRLAYYRETLRVPQDACPHAEALYAGALTLPLFPRMADTDVDRVVGELRAALDATD
jgi:dTDP-4-amino-4,6-dideoxygalactose transaminase